MDRPKPTQMQLIQFSDRLNVLRENVDLFLIQHPVCKLEKKVSIEVEQASDILFKAQTILDDIIKKGS